MKWFRSNIKHGSRLALLALAIQFALSFGHFHGVAAQAAPAIQSGQTQSILLTPATFSRRMRSVRRASSSLRPTAIPTGIRTTFARSAPSWLSPTRCCLRRHRCLLLPQAVEFLYRTTDAEFVHLNSARDRFPASRSPDLLTSIG